MRSMARLATPSPSVPYITPFALLITFLAAGCCTKPNLYEPTLAVEQEDVGPTHFAVVSVSRWEDVKADLQPRFELTPASALVAVAPNTQFYNAQYVSDLSVKLGLGLPTSTSTETDTQVRGSTSSLSDTTTKTTGPGTTPTPTTSNPSRPPVAFPFANSTPGIEPTLQYSLATGLLQYVRLTNRYIEDRVRFDGYSAYVVRMQLSMLPRRRNMPYDTYVDVAFFPATDKKIPAPSPPPNMPAFADLTVQSLSLAANNTSPPHSVIAVPLLTADSVEGLLQSRSIDEIRDLAFSIAATMHNVGGSLSFGSFVDDLKAVLGRDFNSVSAMGIKNDAVLRLRLGALQQATSQFAMVPRQQTVSVVVLVRDDSFLKGASPRLSAVALTKYVNAIDGSVLPYRKQSMLQSDLLSELAGLLSPQSLAKLTGPVLDQLTLATRESDVSAFAARLIQYEVLSPDEAHDLQYLGPLWIRVSNFMSAQTPQRVTVSLPSAEPPMPPPSQVVFLLDDGKAATAVISGGRNLQRVHSVLAQLSGKITTGDPPVPFPQPLVAASTTIVDGRNIQAIFPSLSTARVKVLDAKLQIEFLDASGSPLVVAGLPAPISSYDVCYSVAEIKAASSSGPPNPASMKLIGDSIVASGNAGEIILELTAPTDGKDYFIQVQEPNIRVLSATPEDVLEQIVSAWQIKKGGRVTLKVAGIGSGEPFTILLRRSTGDTVDSKSVKVQ